MWRFLGYAIWYGGIAMLIYGLNECGCTAATQLFPTLAIPFGPKFVCAASAGGIELLRRHSSQVGFGLFCAWLVFWRSLVGALIAGGMFWLVFPPACLMAATIGAMIGFIKTVQHFKKPDTQQCRPVALLPPPSGLRAS
jgi:hypothetical protein